MKEKALLMGPPGSGKSYQLLKLIDYLKDIKKKVWLIDLEDKISATLESVGIPENLDLQVAVEWDEYRAARDHILENCKEGDWIMVDRIDLSWVQARRWYSVARYGQELSERLLQRVTQSKKSGMVVAEFTQGDWQVINDQYDSVMFSFLYKSRCNLVMTAGISIPESGSALDTFGIGVTPRGQKELGHQPHTVLFLRQKKDAGTTTWHVTTAKDLSVREWFDDSPLYDISLQYFGKYYGVKQ